eukprot:TRINITY_DN4451_c0_g2_i1.p1 TRINITY_DN4451_c0_g2~~TRINITY_DN4451_c0_g2_i1.p1  ORF type:complete len:233 (+),score=49.19 TRINITY_DN4451_c0_g2_i1:477-1175(+)
MLWTLSMMCFRCTCSRCEDPLEYGSGVCSIRCACGGAVNPGRSRYDLDAESPWLCDRCGRTRRWAEVRAHHAELQAKVSEACAPGRGRAEAEALLRRELRDLHENHHLRYACHKHLSLRCESSKDAIQDDVRHLAAAAQFLAAVIPQPDPSKVLLHQTQAATLLEVCRRTPREPFEAYRAALEATRDALALTLASSVACFGPDAPTSRTAREQLGKFEAVLGPQEEDDDDED